MFCLLLSFFSSSCFLGFFLTIKLVFLLHFLSVLWQPSSMYMGIHNLQALVIIKLQLKFSKRLPIGLGYSLQLSSCGVLAKCLSFCFIASHTRNCVYKCEENFKLNFVHDGFSILEASGVQGSRTFLFPIQLLSYPYVRYSSSYQSFRFVLQDSSISRLFYFLNLYD